MKRLLFLVMLLGGIAWWFFGKKPVVTPLPSPTPITTPTTGSLGLVENEGALMELSTARGTYRVAWEIVPKEAEIRVGINQELEKSSQQLYDQLSCRIVTNAAFYSTNGVPLGLLVDQSEVVSEWRENLLLNGIVGVRERLEISRDYGDGPWQWAVQAGPILWQGGKPAVLRLNADQAARRVVAGISDENQLVLLVFVAQDSLYLGPLLADLPQILTDWQEETGLVLTDALNLDGGTASAFLSPALKLRELKPIGSYICIQ